MSLLADLSVLLERAPGFSMASAALRAGDDFTLAVPPSIRPLLTAANFRAAPRPTLVVVPGADAADRFARQLTAYLPLESVLTLPSSPTMPWSREPGDLRVTGRRARALYSLQEGRPVIVVASARALLRLLPPRGAAEAFQPLALRAGGLLDLEEAVELLARMGYERLDVAEEPGQFSVRGGTLDVYPSEGHFPVRAELLGDEVESLRRFVPSTGQSVGDIALVEAYPCREIRLSNRTAKDVAHAHRSGFQEIKRRSLQEPELERELELLEQGVYFDGVEAYLPYIYRDLASVTDYLSKDALVTVAEPRALFDDTTRAYGEIEESARAFDEDAARHFLTPAKVDLGGRQRLTMLSILRAGGAPDAELAARRPAVSGGEAKTVGGLKALLDSGHTVLFAARDRRSRESISAAFTEAGLPVATYAGTSHVAPGSERDVPGGLSTRVVNLAVADIPAGYVIPDARLAVVSVDDAYPRSTRRAAASIDPTQITFDFKPGDYVVHATHGIALFRELTRREVLGAERDYLLLEYAKGDKLYVPVDQLDRVTKYVGPDQTAPRVTRLNTADWARSTKKARAAAKKLAFDLVDLYARRSAATGYAFGPDTTWQSEMEAAFPFVETPDQLAAIADVKADMEADKPMDRLVCGDVGYGKTEVAIRAAFKATQDGKQVMVLCPTTILTQQHFVTFSERFGAFPVHVEVMSRFRSKAQQEEAIRGFNDGSVDILIGTHRLLSRDIVPKDLGLVIVDEEQRFGVEHKEHLKNLREQVDVLTMSATPIPRTLQMALGGVRDMSVIDTPPPNRFPVNVHVGEFDPDTVQGAIRRELERGGQVYYVFNRVMTIEQATERVRELVPEATIGVAHGQMSEKQLEAAMESFAAGQIDVLVATTIIESGIDNPHTNTLIIEDSERLGLAQLYQLKGRVGRSHVKAYAYFLFSRGKQLSEQAIERLTAIAELTDLGSGIKVALRDLEIRGAGSLLGAEQSGNLSAVGFDLYAQMLREAVSDARGEPEIALPDIRIDVPVKAYLPDEYVEAADERVRFYRRFASVGTPDGVEAIVADLTSRHGAMPEVASNLAGVARARALAGVLGATNVAVVRNRVVVQPLDLEPEARGKLAALGAVYLERERKLQVPLPYGEPVMGGVLGTLTAILTHTVSTEDSNLGGTL
ncbi:MAG: transcription-repair coupling factor [Coriobacteriia bacterium]|nr:transcription-repair coupling factor [Coriobacteriia bacterium]